MCLNISKVSNIAAPIQEQIIKKLPVPNVKAATTNAIIMV